MSNLSMEALKQQQEQTKKEAAAKAVAEGCDVAKARAAIPCPGFGSLKDGFVQMLCDVDVVLTSYDVIEVSSSVLEPIRRQNLN
jgi:hypothetical protein